MKSSSTFGRILSLGVLIFFPYIIIAGPLIQGPVVPGMYWRTSGGNIFYTGGNVGIGTGNPLYRLDVSGSANIGGNLIATGTANIGSDVVVGGSNITFGTPNASISGPIEIGVGNGGYNANRFVVGASNNIPGSGFPGLQNIVFGYNNTSNLGAYNVHMFGSRNISTLNGLAVGMDNNVGNGQAFGVSNMLSGGLAIGYGNTIGNIIGTIYSFAFGSYNTITANNAYVFGTSINNSITGSLQIGTSDSSKMTLLSNGNFGIGTTNPLHKLHVNGQIYASGGYVYPDGTVGTSASVNTLGAPPSPYNNYLQMSPNNLTLVGGTNAEFDMWALGNMGLDIDAANNGRAYIYLSSTTPSAIPHPDLQFYQDSYGEGRLMNTANAVFTLGTSGSVITTMTPAGNFGIGTTSPGAKLDIYGSSNSTLFSRTWNAGTGASTSAIQQLATGTPNAWTNYGVFDIAGNPQFQIAAGVGINTAVFYLPNYYFNSSTGTNWMTITNTGNVGIGTFGVAGAKLHVSGNIIADTPTASNHVATKAYVDAAISSGGVLKIYQTDNTTFVGYFLNIGQMNFNDGTNINICQATYYANASGAVETLTDGDCVEGYGFLAAVGSPYYYPNSTCDVSSGIFSLGGHLPPGTYRGSNGIYYGRSTYATSGLNMYYGTNMNWSQWNYGTNTCVPVSPYVNQIGYSGGGTAKKCGTGNCIIRP